MEVAAMGFMERIRLEVGGNPPQILRSERWFGSDPGESEFLAYAKEALKSCYEGSSLKPKPGFGVLLGGVPVPEAIRFLGDDGRERWRYTVYDLYKHRQSNDLQKGLG
jgi:hypothetical protein